MNPRSPFKVNAATLVIILLPLLAGCASETEKPKVVQANPDSLVSTNTVTQITTTETETSVHRIEPAVSITAGGVREVIKMVQAGVEESVILTYIERSDQNFSINSDDLVYLHDLGIPSRILTAMIKKGGITDDAPSVALPEDPTPVTPSTSDTNTISATEATVVTTNPVPANEIVVSPPVQTTNVVVQYTTVIGATPTPAEQYYFDSLSPYGTWIYEGSQGWYWQPTVSVINVNWRPYCDQGRWLYTDCGWYWQSDYSWGWAPFHYGRWHRHHTHGWLWKPDRVWSPAWVYWRAGPLHCGWAPLPPDAFFGPGHGMVRGRGGPSWDDGFGIPSEHFVFLPKGRLCEHRPAPFFVGHDHFLAAFDQSRPINRMRHESSHVIINEGPSDRDVFHLSPRPPRQVIIRDWENRAAITHRPDRIETRGSNLYIYRPPVDRPPQNLVPSRGSTRPTRPPSDMVQTRPKGMDTPRREPVLANGQTLSPPAATTDPVLNTSRSTRSSRPSGIVNPPTQSVAPRGPINRPPGQLSPSPTPVVATPKPSPTTPQTQIAPSSRGNEPRLTTPRATTGPNPVLRTPNPSLQRPVGTPSKSQPISTPVNRAPSIATPSKPATSTTVTSPARTVSRPETLAPRPHGFITPSTPKAGSTPSGFTRPQVPIIVTTPPRQPATPAPAVTRPSQPVSSPRISTSPPRVSTPVVTPPAAQPRTTAPVAASPRPGSQPSSNPERRQRPGK